MNSRKNLHAEAVLPLKEGGPSNEEYPGRRDDQNISPKVRAKPGLNKENRSKNQREKPSSKSRQEANHEQLSDISEVNDKKHHSENIYCKADRSSQEG